MQVPTVTLLLGLLGAAAANFNPTGKCNADNCLRAVRATSFPTRGAIFDCLSFQATTITPATFTTTITTTITTTETITAAPLPKVVKAKRADAPAGEVVVGIDGRTTERPTNVPSYASACSGTKRFVSACACYSVGPWTQFKPTPTATAYATVTTVIDGPEVPIQT